MATRKTIATPKTATQSGKQVSVSATVSLVNDIRRLIETARAHVARAANATQTLLNWHVGQRINREVLKEQRADYGKQILATVSQELAEEYGQGYDYSALTRMVKFAEVFPDENIVATLSQQLSWSHFVEILPLKQPLEREYYAELCRIERWSVRTLRERMASQLYLRTAIAKQPDAVVKAELSHLREGGQMTPDMVFRDPYMLDFLRLPHDYSERDLESAILREMERFLLELGVGFTFVARQKRISVGADDFYLDLLFYHRHLQRLVAVELKLEKFQPAHKGQMELYLRWLDKHDRAQGEQPPIGLILCAAQDAEQVELMDLGQSHIRVAEYIAHLPDMKLLQAQLHRAVLIARERAALTPPQPAEPPAKRAPKRRAANKKR
jgi:predicted nuclease of restriction endonuclease-like (RecB) superfamily